MEKKGAKAIEPETDEVVVVRSVEELDSLFEELIRESEAIHRKRTPS